MDILFLKKNVFYFSLMFYNMLNKYVLDVYINLHRIYDANISTGPNNNFFFLAVGHVMFTYAPILCSKIFCSMLWI